eukprot:9561618-Heterocapsa_arctica.AAC.1
MEHDMYGSGLEHFKDETGNRNEWGGAEQNALFAHIHKKWKFMCMAWTCRSLMEDNLNLSRQ